MCWNLWSGISILEEITFWSCPRVLPDIFLAKTSHFVMSLGVNLLSISSLLKHNWRDGIKCLFLHWHQMPSSSTPEGNLYITPATCGSSRSIEFTWQNQKGLPPAYNSTCRIRQTSCTYTMPTKRKPGQPRQDSRFKAVFYSCPLLDDCTIWSALQSLISATSIAQTIRYQISGRVALHSRVEWAVLSTMFTFKVSSEANNKFCLLARGLKIPVRQLFFQLSNSIGIKLFHIHTHRRLGRFSVERKVYTIRLLMGYIHGFSVDKTQ